MRRGQAGMMARDRTAQALADLIDMEIPPTLVESEIDGRINDMAMRMSSQGIDFATYMEAMGRDLATMRDELREGAEIAARVDLGLRAVADAESLSGEGEALDEYLGLLAEQTGGDVDGIREALTSSGRMLEVKADIRKKAALDWVFERASIVDEEGNEVDRALLEPLEPVDEPEMAIPATDDEVGETSDSAPDGDEEE
jgi:trigger factor